MDWSDIGSFVGKAAPLLGSVLTGNIPGAIASAGTLLASAFGCDPTPDAIHQAILQSPDAAVKLAQIEADNREHLASIQASVETAEINASTATVQSVNATLQAEANGQSWLQRNAHPMCKLATVGMVIGVYFVLPLAKVAVPAVPESAFLMLAAILGVTAWQKGRAEVARAAK